MVEQLPAAQGRQAAAGVVFVHGNPGSARHWDRFIGPAADAVRGPVLAPTLPGFAGAPVPPGFGFTVNEYAAWLGEQIDAAGIDRVHLVMHDFGGAFALVWAAGHTGRIASLTLIDTGVLIGYRWHVLARIWRTPVLGELFNAITTRAGFGFMLRRGQPRPLPPAFLDQLYEELGPAARATALHLYRNTDETQLALLADRFRAVDPPTLVLWGAHDVYLPVAQAARQRDVFPAAEIVVLPDSGHWPHADDPDAIERHLVPFLRKAATCAMQTVPS
jgi:pimeloyl-ACP methyl ester carboxylesterase